MLGISATKILQQKTSGFGRRRQDYFEESSGNDGTVDFSGVTDIVAYGDSYTDPGLEAIPASNSYINKMIATMGKALTNRGGTGTGIATAYQREIVNGQAIDRDKGVTIMTGLNDVNLNGDVSSFHDSYKDQLTATLCSLFLKTGIPAGSATYTVPGQWLKTFNPSDGFNKAHQFGVSNKTALGSNVYPTSGTMSYTFTNDHVVLGYMQCLTTSNPGVYLGDFEVRIDGVFQETVTSTIAPQQTYPGWEGGAFGDYQPRVKIYGGLTNASHTIEIRATTNPANCCIIDYFGHLATDSSDSEGVLIFDVTRVINYAQPAPYNMGSDGAINNINLEIREAIANLTDVRPNLPIALAETNSATPAEMEIIPAGFAADGLHYNNTNHNRLNLRGMSKISAY